MHYEENVIDGVLMCRSTPGGEWRAVSPRVMTERLCAALKACEEAESLLGLVKVHVNEYHGALDRREHGGVAEHKAIAGIQQALGMRWEQGASLRKAG